MKALTWKGSRRSRALPVLLAMLVWALNREAWGQTVQEQAPTTEPAASNPSVSRGEQGSGAVSNGSGVKFEGYVQVGFVRNDVSTSEERSSGLSNYPVPQASDENFSFNTIQTFLHKDIGGNITPRVTPRPGDAATSISWGFMIESMYGRNGQAARSFGFDDNIGPNHPGDLNPARAASSRQNFFAFPNVYAQFAFPVAEGAALTVGRFGAGISYEIPVQTKASPNFFYSRTYAFAANPNQVTGVLASANLARGASGAWLGELGVVNGWQNWADNNGQKTLMGALRWRASDFQKGLNFAFITGDEQNDPGNKPQLPNNPIVSPHPQRRNHAAVNGFWESGPWYFAAEALEGKQDGDGRSETVLLGPGGHRGFKGATYGDVNLHMHYTFDPHWALGMRAERYWSPEGFSLLPLTVARGAINALTVGVRYDFNSFMRLCPELRYDKQSDVQGMKAFGEGKDTRQLMGAVDLLVYF
jgi:hypothetical protein